MTNISQNESVYKPDTRMADCEGGYNPQSLLEMSTIGVFGVAEGVADFLFREILSLVSPQDLTVSQP